jgi:hypothetical protein
MHNKIRSSSGVYLNKGYGNKKMHLNVIKKRRLIFLIVLCSIVPLYSQTWVGGVDSLWTTAGNWNSGSVPGFLDNVTINASDRVVLESASGLARSIFIGTNDTLVIKTGDQLTVDRNVLINGVLTLEGSASLSYGGDWNRTGIFNYNQSTITHIGNQAQNIVNSETYYNFKLNKSNQVLRNSSDINVLNDLTIIDGTFNIMDHNGVDLTIGGDLVLGADNVDALDLTNNSADGITILIGGDFTINNTAANSFQAGTSSTIILNGAGSQRLTPAMSGDGETFVNIIVSKNGTDRLDIDNPIQVEGDLKIESGLMKLNGNQVIFGTDSADSIIVDGSLEVDGGAVLKMENGTSLVANSGGTLSVVGSVSNMATITQNTGTYSFEINSGATIEARYYIVEYMNTSGLQIKTGVAIDATNNFSDGTINNIAATGTGLNIGDISGSDQRLLIDNVDFPTNAGANAYNVTKSNSTDTLDFTNSTGNFTGEFFDNDPNNLVIWTNAVLTRQWVGTTSAWEAPSNWSPAGVPSSDDNVEIPGGTSVAIITSAATCNNMLIYQNGAVSVGNISFDASLDVNGNLTIGDSIGASDGTITLWGSSTLAVGGHYYKTDASTLTENNSIITFDGDSTQKITTGGVAANDDFNHIVINKSGGVVTLADDILIKGNFTISNGNFNAGNYNMTVYQNWNNSGTFTPGSGTVTFNAPSTGPFDITTGGSSFNHVTINSANENNIQRLISPMDINGNLTITQGTINANGYDMTIAGNLDIDASFGNFTAGSGTVFINGSSDQTIDPGNVSFNNFTINKPGGTATLLGLVTPLDNLVVDGNFSLISGTFNSGALNIGVGSDWYNSGTWSQNGGTVTFNAVSSGPFTIGNNGSGSFNSVLIDGTNTTYQLTSAMDIDGDLNINTGNTLIADVNTITSSGDWTNNGTFQAGSGTLIFDDSAVQLVNNGSSSFKLVTIDKTANRVELAAATTIDSNLTVLNGELRLDVSTDVNDNVSISPGGIFNMTGKPATVSGSFENAGLMTNPGAVTFDGSSGGPYHINSGSSSFADVIVDARDLVYQLSGNTDINGDLNITAGRLNLNGYMLTFGDGAADAITVSDTLEIDAGAELSFFNGTSIDVNSGAVIQIVGYVSNAAIITEQSKGGSYTFTVNSGAVIHARYAFLEYMDSNGINILDLAGIDATNNFSDVNFNNGQASGTMLSIGDITGSLQRLDIANTGFLLNPGGGATNVTHTAGSDTLHFIQAFGPFAGESFDSDNGSDNLILWSSSAITRVWNGSISNDWNDSQNWTTNIVPVDTEDVDIPATGVTNEPSVSGTIQCRNVTIASGRTLTIQASATLDLGGSLLNNGTLTFNTGSNLMLAGNYDNTNGSINESTSTIVFDGTAGQMLSTGGTAAGNDFYTVVIDKSAGTVSLADDILILGNFTISKGSFDAGSLDMTVYQNWSNSGTFSSGTGTVTFDAPDLGSYDISSGGSSFNHVTINSANENNVHQLADAMDIDGDLTITQGTINANGYDISIAGNLDINTIFGNFTAGTGTLTIDGSTDQTVDPGNVTFNNFTINKSAGTATLIDALVATGNFAISNGTFNSAALDINVGGNWNNSGTWSQSGGTVTLDATNAGPFTISNNGSGSFNTLTIDGTVTGYQLNSAIDIDGALTINTGDTLNASVNTIFSSGNWTNNGTFLHGTGMVVFDGGVLQQIDNGSSSFNRITVNKSADRVQLDAVTTIDSNLTIISGELRSDVSTDVNGSIIISAAGTYNMNSNPATVSGSFDNAGSLINPGTVTFDGSSGDPYNINSGSSSFANVTVNATGLVYKLSGNTEINGNLVITAGKLDLNSQSLIFGDLAADAITVADTLEIDAGAELSLFSGTSVNINSGGVAYIVGEAANNAIVTEQSKAGTFSFSVNSGATIHVQHALLEYMDAGGIQLLTGANLDPVNNFSNVTFDNGPSGGTFLYVENLLGTNQIFTINSASFPSDPGAGAANVTKSVSDDTLDFLTATGSFAGEDYDNDPGGLVRWGSVSDLLTWTGSASTNWHTASNWSPVGVPDVTKAVVITDQVNDPVIGNDNATALNVTLNSGATLTIQDGFDFDIDGDLTNSNGIFTVGNTTSTINISGDWANSGTFTHGNSTVTFDGSDKQTVNGGGTGTTKSLHNMYCTNPDTIELQGSLDVDGDLYVSNGYLNLNGNQLLVGDAPGDSLSVSGDVIINDDAILQMSAGTRIVVESGGNLQIQGSSPASRPRVTNQGSGNYSIEVLSGGTIIPELATIENTGGNGVEINSGATINATAKFDNVLFQNGAGTAYLTVENGQTLNPVGIQFDSTASNRTTYNVVYSGTGQIRLSDYTGTMSGACFESDNGSAPHGNLQWDFHQTEVINNSSQTFGNDAVVTSTANLASVDVQLVDQTLSIAPASVARYYTIETQNSAIATVRLYYGQDELQGEVEADLQIWSRRNDIWQELASIVNTSQNYVEVPSLSYTFSAGVIDTFILSDAQNEESLPVELLSFTAVVFEDSVGLNWKTASELENAFWYIEKMTMSRSEYEKIQDGEIFIDETKGDYNRLAQIQGMGSKPTLTTYHFVDHDVDRGKIYAYRLSSVSYDGEIERFTPVLASYLDAKIPMTYTLEQNYPNPFNPITVIKYQIPFDSKVIIAVYNILGQMVITLVDGEKQAGFYQIQWDGLGQNGTKIASGMYIYRMTAEAAGSRQKFSQNKRMIMLK